MRIFSQTISRALERIHIAKVQGHLNALLSSSVMLRKQLEETSNKRLHYKTLPTFPIKFNKQFYIVFKQTCYLIFIVTGSLFS